MEMKLFFLRLLGYISPQRAGRIALAMFTTPLPIPRPPWENELVAIGHQYHFKNSLIGFEWGSGPTVLLIHGWQGRGTQLGALVKPLVARGFRVVALDGPAHGESRTSLFGPRTNVRMFSNALIEVGHELGPLKLCVAHSFGAGSLVIALSEGMKSDGAVLVASPSSFQKVVNFYKARLKMNRRWGDAFQNALETWAGVKVRHMDILKLASPLNIPALIVHDPEDDIVAFANAEALAAQWPKAKLVKLHGVGHAKILKASSFVDAVVDFILKL
jgi:pimeloyl-ACP methyl ester carboxylesterase